MAGYSASYSFNSWFIGRVYINSYRIVANFMQAPVFLLEIQHFKYVIKIGISKDL